MTNTTNEWKTVFQIDTVHKAHLIRSQLELEGFEVLVLDEYSTQYVPNSNLGSGGVRIQVREEDWEQATELLIRLGHILEEESESSSWLEKLARFTSKIPLLGKIRFEARLLLLIALLLSAIIIPIGLGSLNSEEDRLAGTSWCVVEVEHKKDIIDPQVEDITLSVDGCPTHMQFSKGHTTLLPAFGDRSTHAKWSVSADVLKIEWDPIGSQEGHDNLMLGSFDYKLEEDTMILKSGDTRITLVRN